MGDKPLPLTMVDAQKARRLNRVLEILNRHRGSLTTDESIDIEADTVDLNNYLDELITTAEAIAKRVQPQEVK